MSVDTAARTRTLRLSWDDPSTGEEREWVGRPPVTIGRTPDNGVVLNAEQVSRRHARLEFDGTSLILSDEGSSNGTYVNGERVPRAALGDGDSFVIGPFTLLVDLDADGVLRDGATMVGRGHAPAAAPAAAFRLRWSDPAGGERDLAVTERVSIGRSADNTIALQMGEVSRHHAVIAPEAGALAVTDQGSGNGTFVNGARTERAVLRGGDVVSIGGVRFAVEASAPAAIRPTAANGAGGSNGATQIIDPVLLRDQTLARQVAAGAAEVDGRTLTLDVAADLASLRSAPMFPPPIFTQPVVPVAALAATGLQVDETTYLAIGGGIGSFVWVDHLVVYGVPARQITALGLEEKPYGRYARLCAQSQIPSYERLRSNSDSCPDNIWGWPGYAVREIGQSLLQGDFANMARRGWQIFGEPTLAETYTPRAGDVFTSIDREAERIGWTNIWRYGRVKAIRKTDDGRYVVAYSQSTAQQPSVHRLMLARYVHVSVGYPGIRLLPDLQRYREATGDFRKVVNAYEDHEQVYQGLLKNGGTVLVRGRGIVASRILQRLSELRAQNPRIGVLHLMRSPLAKGNRFGRAQREVNNHWEFQPFNWPKACWGGELRFQLERAGDQQRDLLLNDWGGTTTADRQDWVEIVDKGLREGWYQIRFGDVKRVEPGPDGKVVTTLAGKGVIQDQTELKADYIIDCTGLEATVDANPLLKDLVDHHGLQKNVKGRLRVANDFEIEGMANGPSRMYAAGAMTLGGPMAAVDSFLGLQYAAIASLGGLRRNGAPGVGLMHPLKSGWQWLKWAIGAQP